ncbi:MAG TPA: hypothetical protein VIP11_07490 [Gemmatimonadaceae bacterium]
MLLHAGIVALLLQAGPALQSGNSSSPAAPNPAIDPAGFAVLRFLSTWRTAWLQSDSWRSHAATPVRMRDVHCHWDGSYGASGYRTTASARPPSLIHRSSRRSMCPNWFPSDERIPDDESRQRDVSLSPMWRDRVHTARAKLLDTLAMFDAQRPGDAWITGARVRFLVDQGELTRALDVARACKANRPWCAQLTGFVFDAAGDFARADSAFDAATAAMDSKARCEWIDVRHLLDPDGRSAYDRLSCDERVQANERLWWLAMPLYSDSASDRRSQDYARKVLIQLHAALPWDERFDWRNQFGGEAVSEMLMRYGWPAFSTFTGLTEERSHAGWMSFYDSTRTATTEYPQNRLHLIPDYRAIQDPFRARSDLWRINMPRLKDGEEPVMQWWPAEHYGYSGGTIVQLDEQTAFLRRDDNLLLATASELRQPNGIVMQGNTDGSVLIRTTGPRVIERLQHQTYRNENGVVLTAYVPPEPAIIGTELRATRLGDVSARTRLGVVPPQPLSALKPGETAISEPVLLATDDAAPPGPERALQKMLGTTRVRGPKLGVYWETYGYAPGDSVDVAVVITRREQLSKMRKLGMFFRVAHDINGSVAVQWTEPQAGHDSWSIPGIVPIQARSIRADLSRLEPGRYSVEVRVNRKGVLPISASRDFVLERY